MNVYVINVENAIIRKNKISKNLKDCGYDKVTFFKAVEPKDIKKYEELYSKNFKYKEGTLACALSHTLLLKEIELKNFLTSPILVLEDDIVLNKSSKSMIYLLNNFLNDHDQNWDILYLSWGLQSNTHKLWEGQKPLIIEEKKINNDWSKIGQLINFYFIRKIKKESKVVEFFEWSDIYVDWCKNDVFKYRSFQNLINQSAYIINPKRVNHILSKILPIDEAIDIKIFKNLNDMNIYMLSPSLEIVRPDLETSKDSLRLDSDYKKDIHFLWPKYNDILNKKYDYTFKILMHKSLIHNEDYSFIKDKCQFLLNNNKIVMDIDISYNEDDFTEISFILDKDTLCSLPEKNRLEFIFETFWSKEKIKKIINFSVS
jgi:GR25 family glycosyltransferase involved in LPS biosynthesis